MSPKDTLNKADILKWAKNTLLFSLPAITVFLIALRGGVDPRLALGMAYQALIASSLDLLTKYSSGAPSNVSSTTTTSTITVAEPVVPEATPEIPVKAPLV